MKYRQGAAWVPKDQTGVPARIKWGMFWQGTFPDKMRVSTEKTT